MEMVKSQAGTKMRDIYTYHKDGSIEKIERLVLPESPGHVKALEEKLEEYKSRIVILNSEHVLPTAHVFLEQTYKAKVLSKVINQWQVDVEELYSQAEKQENFNSMIYEDVIRVIYDYLITKGQNLYGGTGLKVPDLNSNGKVGN